VVYASNVAHTLCGFTTQSGINSQPLSSGKGYSDALQLFLQIWYFMF
jgi:hypothetical protein